MTEINKKFLRVAFGNLQKDMRDIKRLTDDKSIHTIANNVIRNYGDMREGLKDVK